MQTGKTAAGWRRLVAVPAMLLWLASALLAAAADGSPSADVVYEIADIAYSRLILNSCYETYGAREKCTRMMNDMTPKDVRLYFGGLLPGNETVLAVLPDNDAKLADRVHHGFLVPDPFPAYKFGHPLFMFYLDVGVAAGRCEDANGLYTELSDNSTICIHVVRSKRCNERPIMTSWDCQIKFLPLVVPTSSRRLQSDNVLECMDKKDTFLMNCPTLREEGTELSDECNQLKTNNKDCNLGNFKCTSQKLINQAVLLFGGWSRNVADFMTANDLTSLRDHLLNWGFGEYDIRTFFANGLKPPHVEDDDADLDDVLLKGIHNVEPADKLNIRRYIKSVCHSDNCVNTFFLYLASPTRKEGQSLLWDANSDGIVDSDEMYLAREFVGDISNCSVRRVVVFVDQSFSAYMVRQAVISRNTLENVLIIPTTGLEDWVPRHIFDAYMRDSNKLSCLSSYVRPFQESQVMPQVFTGRLIERYMDNVTISGISPCVL